MPLRPAPNPKFVNDQTPLRLDDAVRLAFPCGGMTVSGLRREAARGRLVIERVAGKDFVTLRAIDEMREKCRVQTKGHASGSDPQAETPPEKSSRPHDGSSKTEAGKLAQAAALLIARKLKEGSPITSPANTRRKDANVLYLKRGSPT